MHDEKTTEVIKEKGCLNPDVSLAELYRMQEDCRKSIFIMLKAKLNGNMAMQSGLDAENANLKKIQAQIEQIKNAGKTGGIIRLI